MALKNDSILCLELIMMIRQLVQYNPELAAGLTGFEPD